MRTILIVEDSNSMRGLMEMALTSRDYQVISMSSAEAVIDSLDEISFDIAIIDIHLGKLNGIELAKAIRAHKKHPGVVLIAVTTEGNDSMKEEGRKAGLNEWVQKPIRPDKFISTIEKYI